MSSPDSTGPRNARNRGRAVVVMPTYNERENLAGIVAAILEASPELDVLVVDDNSPDGTGEIADDLVRSSAPRIRVMHRARKEGLGPAYLAGFSEALALGYGRILQMDADFSHDPTRLPALLSAMSDCDVAVGSRYVEGGGTANWGLGRRLLSRGGSLYGRSILGLSIHDLTGAFRCYRRDVLESLDLPTMTSTGYAFQIELIYRVVRHGYRVREVPFTFVDRRAGKSKMTGAIIREAIWKIWQIRFGSSARGASPR